MGIRKIFPAARALAPNSISAPFPLSVLRGLRVAIDATLVTQRLHFADDPHASRHLIGFYRLIRSLRQVGVQPIMVFDHPRKRLALKEREQEKRRERRNLDLIRSRLESERRQRLQGLGQYLKDIQALSVDERLQAGAMLQRWNASKASERRLRASEIDEDQDLIALLSEKQSLLAPIEQDDWWSDLQEVVKLDSESLQPDLDILAAAATAEEPELEPESPIEDEVPPALPPDDMWLETVGAVGDPQSKPHAIAYNINMLQTQLQVSYRRLENNHSQTQKMLAEGESRVYEHITQQLLDVPKTVTPSAQVQADRAMMQALDSLQVNAKEVESATSDELIKSDAASLETGLSTPSVSSPSLSSLERMNSSLSKAYDRVTMSLSASVYQDCAKLSSLMAVPVFWTGDGTREGGGRIHEAEAYAASLVQAGYADLVASEDSDVLLYDAVLLRGLVGGVKVPSERGKTKASSGERDKRVEIVGSARLRQRLFPYEEVEALHSRLMAQKQARLAAQAEEKEQKRLRSRNAFTAPAAETASDLAPPTPEPFGSTSLSPEEYDRMTRDMMLDFALLCGTDFNQTMPFIGPMTAHKLLKQHGSISAILEDTSSKYKPPGKLSVKEYEAELRDARSVFTHPPAVKATARSVFKATGLNAHPAATTAVTEEQLFDLVSERLASGTDSTPPSAVQYDEEAVIAFLRSHGVMRFSESDGSARTSSQDWRDEMDSELGISLDSSSQAEAAKMVTSDYFGQSRRSNGASGVACWKPGATQADVQRETNLHSS